MSRPTGGWIAARRSTALRAGALVLAAAGIALFVSARFGAADTASRGPAYEVYRPAGLSRARPVPLVVGLGGAETRDDSGFNSFADRYGFVVAYPDPYLIQVPGNEDAQSVARINYLSDIIDELKANQNIDPTRVYFTGGSKSGIQSYRAACKLANKITAIGSVAAALPVVDVAACRPARPLSVMEIHGTADSVIPYNGNQLFESAESTAAFFRAVDGCKAPPAVSTRGRVTTQTWGPCKAGTSVRLVTYAGGDHGWPRNTDLDTTAQLWSFFTAHSSATAAAQSSTVLQRLRVMSSSGRRVLVIRVSVPAPATIRATVRRAAKRFGSKVFRVKPGVQTLRVPLAHHALPGSYRLELVITNADGTKQSLVKSFRLRG